MVKRIKEKNDAKSNLKYISSISPRYYTKKIEDKGYNIEKNITHFTESKHIIEKIKQMNKKLNPEDLVMLALNAHLDSSNIKNTKANLKIKKISTEDFQAYIPNKELGNISNCDQMNNNNNNFFKISDKNVNNSNNNYSYNRESARFISDVIKTQDKTADDMNKNNLNIPNKNSEKVLKYNENEMSFRVKNSSKNIIFHDIGNSTHLEDDSKAIISATENKCEKIIEQADIDNPIKNLSNKKIILNDNSVENTVTLTLDQSNIYPSERASVILNNTNNIIYEKYNKGLADKMLKSTNGVDIYQKNPLANLDNSINNKDNLNNSKDLTSLIDLKNTAKIFQESYKYNEDERLTKAQKKIVKFKIFREFLKVSFQLFNGDTIRNWLYDNYLKEKQKSS